MKPLLPQRAVLIFIRHNNKQLDLSRSIRLSGLTSGAKLELVQLSKSAGVVSVALQLPPAEVQQGQARLTDKLPSSTTLWQLLRQFEVGAVGQGPKRNLTARGVPSSGAGAGRLYYEQPVLHIMGRDLTTFTDLQKTLAQLGFNSGSVLVKLSYSASSTPLEEALSQMQTYFNEGDPQPTLAQAQSQMAADEISSIQATQKVEPEWPEDQQIQQRPAQPSEPQQQEEPDLAATEPMQQVSDRPVSIYRPPTSSGPTSTVYNEADYTPTVEHAQIHQQRLQQESRNRRLPTDAELLAKQKEQHEELVKIESIEIKIRFPDQSAISSKFGQDDTTNDLYRVVRDHLDPSLSVEPFILTQPGVRTQNSGTLREDSKKLITDHHFKGRILVVFSWDDKASANARATKQVLEPEVRQQAQEYIPPEVPNASTAIDDPGTKVELGTKEQKKEEGA